MTYSESANGITITKARALHELARHYVTDEADIAAFFAELGDHETYKASAVLAWLGY